MSSAGRRARAGARHRRAEIGGRLGSDQVAGVEKNLAEKVEALHPGRGDEDVVAGERQAPGREAGGQRVAQARHPSIGL